MRRMIGVVLVFWMVSQVLSAQLSDVPDKKADQPQKEHDSFSMLLGRFGYFQALEAAFKDIYGNGAVYGGELRLGGKRIAGWLEGTYRERTGKLSFTGEETKVNVMAVESGALFRIIPGNISPYVAAGIGYYMFKESNQALGVAKQGKIGFCGAAGFSVIFVRRLVLDCRLKYSSCKMQPADYRINIGGLTLGLGLGVHF